MKNLNIVEDYSGLGDKVNMGIAIVAQAQKILEVLMLPELRAERAELEGERRRKELPEMDFNRSEHSSDMARDEFESAQRGRPVGSGF